MGCLDPNYKPPKCGAPGYVGDGNCDDANNTKECQYDKGDCCGPKVKKAYCKICKCLDPKYKKPACGAPGYVGDGNCDDANNTKDCKYDKGDCCAATVPGGVVKKKYCKKCKCIDPKGQKDPNCAGVCGNKPYVRDGNCDDDNNNCGCKYDGGDCCKSTNKNKKLNNGYCKDCSCLDPKAPKKDRSCKKPPGGKCAVKTLGDGYCDDENNYCGCQYDGGDCCPDKQRKTVRKTYCKRCKCINQKAF